VVTDAILPLLDKGILTGAQKSQLRHKIVASTAFGSQRLYDTIDRNPLFSFAPIDVVCHPATIAAQHRMVSVSQVFAIDLTGQACSDQFGGSFYGGIGTQGDFLRGASRSAGGKPILCLASTTDDGQTSRIRPQLLEGEGVSVARSDVHYVITEYGIAYLFGKSVRERAIALIELAHPNFRPWLLEQAKALGHLAADQTLENMRAYPVEEERHVTLKDGRRVLLRPARASDATGVRDLFFHLPDNDIYTRFFRRVRALSTEDVRRLCNYDQQSSVGFVAVTGPRDHEVIVGQCCYFVNPSSNTAETAFLVDSAWQGCGLGGAMQRRLVEHAQARGLRGFTAEILPQNSRMLALAKGGDGDILVERDEDSVIVTTLF
jgi:RimJ/RimL family protein N-acetyltransferase